MRPSRSHKTGRLVCEDSGDRSQPKPHRLRRARKQQDDNQDQEHDVLASQKIITRKEGTPLRKSHTSFELSPPARRSKTHPMPSGSSLPSLGNVPKLTKTGRVSKAKKGIKGAHRCGCGKTYSRAEHLRRHQQNHDKQLPCLLCGKNFHRQDLYDRHLATKHNGNSSRSISRRTSATSGSLVLSLPARPSLSSTLTGPLHSTHHPSEVAEGYSDLPQNSHFNSRNQTSEAPSRYSPNFIPTTPRITFSSDPIIMNSDPNSTDPTSRSDASYIKDEPYPQPYYPNATFGELSATTTESHPTSYLAARPSLSSSGDVSPFSPFSFSASWAETTSVYMPSNLAEPISFAYNSSTITSPRIFSAHMQMPNWMESGTDVPPFPTSAITSPSSSCAPAIAPVAVPIHPSGAPYPLAFVGQNDKYGSLDIESPLEEQQLGVELSLKTKQHYLEAYWTRFDPFFPVVHKASHRPGTNPLLTAAMMAIGAQYTDEEFARSDSRILHEKCLELIAKYKEVLSTATRLDYMQAIFLVEVLSHYRAKRTAARLSEVFLSMYASLWKYHANNGRSYIEGLSNPQSHLNDDELRIQWSQWVATMGFCRLLTACYIFETMQALILARTTQTAPTSGLELFMPVPAVVWDASNHVRWAQMISQHRSKTSEVADVLDDIWTNNAATARNDLFQSMLLIACNASSVMFQKQELRNAPFPTSTATHSLFEPGNVGITEGHLFAHATVISLHHLVQLASKTPLRALLASSGESWVLSQRLSQEALIAAAEFVSLKAELRTWTEPTPQTFFSESSGDNLRSAVQHSLAILKACLNAPITNLTFGPDIALYYACLVLWAVTYSAVKKAEDTGTKFENSDRGDFEPARAQQDVRTFCEFAEAELSRDFLQVVISGDCIASWRHSISAVLQWSSWALGGARMNTRGLGELVEGAVTVLDRLKDRGWQGEWF